MDKLCARCGRALGYGPRQRPRPVSGGGGCQSCFAVLQDAVGRFVGSALLFMRKNLSKLLAVAAVAHAGGAFSRADDAPGAAPAVSFVNDILPRLVKAGCAGGNCHAKPEGQNNFKLSVFGYDPEHDYKEIVMDGRGRRIFPASPEHSLLLRKATGEIPHEGGALLRPGDGTYELLLDWLRQGAPFRQEGEPNVTAVTLRDWDEVFARGETRQLQVMADYSDGSTKDVTGLTEFFSQNSELAIVDHHGAVTAGRVTGEGVVVARFMGLVKVARVTIPAETVLPESAYSALPVNNEIDRLAYERHKKLGLLPSEICTDEEFLRRASLDLIGKLPDEKITRDFLADTAADKRERLVDALLRDQNYADHWAVKWGDLIRPNPSRVGVKPVYLMDDWLRQAFRQNMPFDEMVRRLLTAQGSTHQQGPVAIFRDKRDAADMGAFVSQIFLGMRLDCAQCHHHPSEKWDQDDYYALAAFFARMKRKGQGISAPISGEAEYWWAGDSGSVSHPVTEAVMTPKPPDGPEMPYVEGQDPRARLVDWMTASDNPFFARAIVNRVWADFMGRGIVEPVDDFRESNPPSNEALLEWLAADFTAGGYDLKRLMRTIALSRIYQLSAEPNATNAADTVNFSRFMKRRLTAEVLMDAVADVTGVADKFSGMTPGSRAVQTWNHKLKSDFLDAFGRPNASQECPCERDRKSSVTQALHLMNSSDLQTKLASKEGRLRKLADDNSLSDPELVRRIYLLTLNRLPEPEESAEALRYLAEAAAQSGERAPGAEDLAWALINSAEFVFNH
jgi:hypothetical protein